MYGLNLALALVFTASGSMVHYSDPLPQVSTPLWKLFLVTLSSTPILFPIVLQTALNKTMSGKAWFLTAVWFCFSATFHIGLALTSFDFSSYLPPLLLQPIVLKGFGLFPDRVLDGTSVGGEPYGVPFDLLSSMPMWRGDSVYPHCMLFTVAVILAIKIAFFHANGTVAPNGMKVALVLMLMGQVGMVPMLSIFGVKVTFDLWHFNIGVVMALIFFALRGVVTEARGGGEREGEKEKEKEAKRD